MKNKKTKTVAQFIEIAKLNEWSVEQNSTGLELSTHSDLGQEFSIYIRGGSFDELVEDLTEYYHGMDADEMASIWIGADGRGRKGAPYNVSGIIEDMEQCIEMVEELLGLMYNNGNMSEQVEIKKALSRLSSNNLRNIFNHFMKCSHLTNNILDAFEECSERKAHQYMISELVNIPDLDELSEYLENIG